MTSVPGAKPAGRSVLSTDLLAADRPLGSARFACRGERMASIPFRVRVRQAVPALGAALFAVALTGCTAPISGPQAGKPVGAAPLPEGQGAASAGAIQPPPGGKGMAQSDVTSGPKIALLVPLTGPNRPIGQAMLDAGNLALFDVSGDFAILPRDTGSTPEGAGAAAAKAVADGTGLILGPVFGNSVASVRAETEAADVPVVAFSNDASVAGGPVFIAGFLPTEQVDRVVSYAHSRGLTKLAVLVPDTAYGTAVSTEIGALRDRLALPPPRIVTLTANPKADLDTLAQDPPEMLMVAVGGDQLRTILAVLGDFRAAHPVQLLGTGLWDDPSLAQIPVLTGAWYAAPIPGNFERFAGRFQQTYNYRPPRIASLAYDAVALSAAIIKGAPGNPRPFSRDVLTKPNGFLGIDGPFRFLDSGLNERALAVLALGPNGPTTLDPPPPGFEKLGE
jgi:ABC-type branched-subunit amino acid transport system substrate-binding protein